MTVEQLIEVLQQVQDKNKTVTIQVATEIGLFHNISDVITEFTNNVFIVAKK